MTEQGGSDYDPVRGTSAAYCCNCLRRHSIEPLKQALLLAQAAVDKKSLHPVLLEVTDLVSYADYLLIVTASSKPHIEAIISTCNEAAKANDFHRAVVEGVEKGKWVLVDYGDVILHVFQQDERGYYDLEGLWRDAPRVDIPGVEEVPFPMDYHAS